MKNLYIVDGQKAVCQMLAESLARREYNVVGTSEGIVGAMGEIVELAPQVVILEVNLSDGQGADLIARVRARLPAARFLVFSDNKMPENIKACLQAGAHGFVEKSVDFSMLLNAIRIVQEGGCFFGFNVTEVLRSAVSSEGKSSQYDDNLTHREREVLQLIAKGNSNKDIASLLNLSIKTVDNHRCSMMRKLDVHNVAAITRYAIEHRLIPVIYAV